MEISGSRGIFCIKRPAGPTTIDSSQPSNDQRSSVQSASSAVRFSAVPHRSKQLRAFPILPERLAACELLCVRAPGSVRSRDSRHSGCFGSGSGAGDRASIAATCSCRVVRARSLRGRESRSIDPSAQSLVAGAAGGFSAVKAIRVPRPPLSPGFPGEPLRIGVGPAICFSELKHTTNSPLAR
jgi:hypothetical protein